MLTLKLAAKSHCNEAGHGNIIAPSVKLYVWHYLAFAPQSSANYTCMKVSFLKTVACGEIACFKAGL